MSIGKCIPTSVKRCILAVVRTPEKIHNRIFQAAALGKIPFPDKAFIKWQYKVFMGKRLNLKNPKTYNEKLQWLKYYYRIPTHIPLVDKYEVRSYIASLFGEEHLIPCYGVFECWDDIDFEALPNEFVVKCTHDSGSVAICRDKATWDCQRARELIEKGLAHNQFYLSREWPYKHVKPRIIVEALLRDEANEDLKDYKFMCFNGQAKAVYTVSGREAVGGPYETYFDMNWERLPVAHHYEPCPDVIEKPVCFDQMVACANRISEKEPFVRVDFYEVNGKMYFGEITFFPSGGRFAFNPESFDELFGSWITLPAIEKR